MTNTNKFNSIFSRISGLIFIILLLVLAYIYDFDRILFLDPQSVHMYRQSDCLSYALNYYMENRGFFEPSFNFIGVTGNGQTVSDFPLIYYVVGKIWQFAGQHIVIYRGLVLLLFFTGLFFLYRTLARLFEDRLWAILISLMLFTSPVLSYYSSSFLMEIPSLSLVLIGWYFFFRFYQSGNYKWLWINMLLFALAGLLKASALLSYFALLGLFISEWSGVFLFRKDRPIFVEPRRAILPFTIVIVAFAAWLAFVINYNNAHNSGFFLVGVLPIWDMNMIDIKIKLREITTHWIFHNFPGYFQVLMVVFWTVMAVFPKKNNRILYYLNIVLAIGVVMYLLLFFQVIAGHDYYWINLFILLLVTTVSFVYFLKTNLKLAYKWGKLGFMVLLVFNVIYTQKRLDERYHGAYMDYYNWYMKDFSSIKKINRDFGIQRDDLVISIPDVTINASLYLMDQKGWTTYGGYNNETEDFYREYIARGAKYLFVSDSTLLKAKYLEPFMKHKIIEYNSITVFDLQNIDLKHSLKN